MNFKKISTILTTIVCTTVNAQTGTEWDNPSITSVNRETAHTIAIPMASEADIAQNDMTLSPWFQSLNGQWKFMWVAKPASAKEEWCAKDFADGSWTTIDVPSSWQVIPLPIPVISFL